MLSTTTTALSTSMPTASSRPIIDRMLSVTPAKYMKPSVITKQIGIASVTISVDGQWRRKKNSTAIDSTRPMPPASARLVSELVTLSPWLSMTLIWMPLQRGLLADRLDFLQRACCETSTRLASRSLKMSRPTAGRPSRRRP